MRYHLDRVLANENWQDNSSHFWLITYVCGARTIIQSYKFDKKVKFDKRWMHSEEIQQVILDG